MQFNKVLKWVLFFFPMLILTACSSSMHSDDNSSTSTLKSHEQHKVISELDNSSDKIISTMDENEYDLFQEKTLKEKFIHENKMIHFAFDDAFISEDYQKILENHAIYLRQNMNIKILIEGHADERGTPEYNIALGERRAQSVADYLQVLGVQENQVSIISYGEEKPVLLGHTEEAYAKNRRAVLVY
ncbi:peptidoglycan-associated lipoprotein [Candidatus Photodesmus katoptron]|uniref:peptidoglycan-associated lipoprotein Pal n=1 Tax=Candidatus Photodesmus anomalopis TaxID=28176 RepID=UPI0004D7BD76|nr:peptidoglycan-associated lipoprotein Pal [Candidatus Photodesmus katoptron]KEY90715.1 peptidoglycan-associated lipoprotein [Candidatus Photodesmus katoptron]